MDKRRKFFNLSIDMLCIANSSGQFLDVNEAFTKVLGYDREELLSQPFLNLIHPDDLASTEVELKRLSEGKKTILFENRYRHKDGNYLTLSWSSVTDDESGLVYAVARDMTEQVNLRNRLLQIERALERQAIVAVLDREGVIAAVNDGLCETSGYLQKELIGQHHSNFTRNFLSPEAMREASATLGAKAIWAGVARSRRKDGTPFFAHTLLIPLLDHEGNVSGYYVLCQDITDEVRNEEQLERTISILNETNSIARVGGWELNVETEELNWTDETFRILEVEKRDDQKPVLPQGLKLFTPECQPIIERAVSRAIQFGEPYSLELEAQTAKGNVLWVYTNGKANYRDGKVVTLSGTIQDIHARKTAELRYEAEHRRVIHDAKMASLGELAASMAHELNNPLGIAAGYAELALETPNLPAGLEKKLRRILKSCERMSHIVTNLKRFSRSEKEPLDRKPHLLSKVIHEAVALTDSRLKSERVRLEVNCESLREVVCSEIEIEQVFINLINNAIDAISEQEEKWIRIHVSDRDDLVEVRVLDSGPGIPESESTNIFTPFFTTKSADHGTGLGLAISREILEDHGAQLYYDRDQATTCFVITFPSHSPEGGAP